MKVLGTGRKGPAVIVALVGLFLLDCARSRPIHPSQLSEGDFTRLFEATVFIRVVTAGGSTREGSGFIANRDGWIVTSYHVVGASQDALLIEYANGKVSSADVVYGWSARDLAVIVPRQPAHIDPLHLGDSGRLEEGEILFACGIPLGLGRTLTRGTVEGRSAFESDRYIVWEGILADGVSYPGDSGGPVVNDRGKVVGLHLGSVAGRRRAVIPSSLIRRTLVEAQVRAEIRRRQRALESAALTY
jgi:S1-C subfamily serine protease